MQPVELRVFIGNKQHEREVLMIVASGFVEVNSPDDSLKVKHELYERGVEIPEGDKEKLVFLIEKETEPEIRNILNEMQHIEGVRSVLLNYYSLPGADKGPDFTI